MMGAREMWDGVVHHLTQEHEDLTHQRMHVGDLEGAHDEDQETDPLQVKVELQHP
jgi:hypothetical protein